MVILTLHFPNICTYINLNNLNVVYEEYVLGETREKCLCIHKIHVAFNFLIYSLICNLINNAYFIIHYRNPMYKCLNRNQLSYRYGLAFLK